MLTIDGSAAVLFARACGEPLFDRSERERGPRLDEAAIHALLPHRQPFLFVDLITWLDTANGIIAGRYDIQRDPALLAAHFPGHAVWPGVLQVEAVGQVGLCLVRAARQASAEAPPPEGPSVQLTEILAARFARPVTPGADVEMVACIVPDGLFTIVVGQCLQGDEVCSAVALRGLEGAWA